MQVWDRFNHVSDVGLGRGPNSKHACATGLFSPPCGVALLIKNATSTQLKLAEAGC